MPIPQIWFNGRYWPDPRGTRAGRALSARVIREEPICWLQLPGCTQISTRGDHVLTVKERPDLALVRSNVRGACDSCNRTRGSMPIESIARHAPSAALNVFG